MIKRVFSLFAFFAAAIPAAAQEAPIEPHPRHVWEYDRQYKVARYGTPETDDLVLTVACEKRGRILMHLPLDVKAVDRKKIVQFAKGKDVGLMMKAPGKPMVSLYGTPAEFTMGDDEVLGWTVDVRMSVKDKGFTELLAYAGEHSRIELEGTHERATRMLISLHGAETELLKVKEACGG